MLYGLSSLALTRTDGSRSYNSRARTRSRTRNLHSRLRARSGFCSPSYYSRSRSPRLRSGFSIIEAIGVVVIGVIFASFTFSILSRQVEDERAQELAGDLRLMLDAGEKYVRANVGTVAYETMMPGVVGAMEICVSDLEEGGFLSSASVLAGSGGARIYMAAGLLPHSGTVSDTSLRTYFVAAFTHGASPLVSSVSARSFRHLAAEKLGRYGGIGTGARAVYSYSGVGDLGSLLNFSNADYTPAWTFQGNDLPIPMTLNACVTGTGAANLAEQLVAVAFVNHYPAAALELEIPPGLSEGGVSVLNDARKLRDIVKGHIALTYVDVDNMEMGILQALRLQLVGDATNPPRLRVSGDLRVPALRIDADWLYLGSLTVRPGSGVGGRPKFGLRGPAATVADYSAGDNLRVVSPFEANRTVVDSLRVGVGYPRERDGTIDAVAAGAAGYLLDVGDSCGTVNLSVGDDNACAAATSINSN
ncbi:MAG: hypothetical protein OD811_01870 [Alphaproteobacteria bacterium]